MASVFKGGYGLGKSRQGVLFAAAFITLILLCALVSPYDLNGHDVVDVYELWALQLGHKINSIWVAVSLLMLLIPSVIAWRRGVGDRARWWIPDMILGNFIMADAFGKNLLPLPRPYHPDQNGFPSGHTTFAFALAWLVTEKYPKLGPLWYAIAIAIGWSRVEVHAHYPYQVYAGAIFGILLGYLVSRRQYGFLIPRIFLTDKANNATRDAAACDAGM